MLRWISLRHRIPGRMPILRRREIDIFNYTQSVQAKKKGNVKEAAHYLELALEEDPESLLLKRELTLLYIYEGKFEVALEMIKQVLQRRS